MTGGTARRAGKGWALVALSLAFTLLFLGLGVWQIERREWKLALIEAVEDRIHAQPQPAPPPASWTGLSADRDAYRRVSVGGRFLHDRSTLVQALTEDGAGYWVLTPLATQAGDTILVNRGFAPADRAQAARCLGCAADAQTVTGLLRISEPGGGFLRANQPAADRWFSRDVAAIGSARGLERLAPYFIDAASGADPAAYPRGGLTVVRFPNNHLVYALTWFALAALSFAGLVLFARATLKDRATG